MNIAWLAGFFDGEGHVSIVARTLNQPTRRAVVRVGIAQNQRAILEEIAREYGGWVREKTPGPLSPRPCYEWGSGAQSVVHRFLTDVRPFLRIKGEKADEALALTEDPYDPNVCRRGHQFTPENTVYRKGGKRRCRACARVRYGSPHPRGSYNRNPEHLATQAELLVARPAQTRRYP
jgi:hypothetical protein